MKRILLVLSVLCLGCKKKVEQPAPQLTYEQKLNELGIYFGKKYLYDLPHSYPVSYDSVQFNSDTSRTEYHYNVVLTYPISISVNDNIVIEMIKSRPNYLLMFSDFCRSKTLLYQLRNGWAMLNNGKGIKTGNQ